MQFCLEELEQVVDVGNKTFRSCLLGDEGQEGREELLVACVQETLA